jgi:hypothetical protein
MSFGVAIDARRIFAACDPLVKEVHKGSNTTEEVVKNLLQSGDQLWNIAEEVAYDLATSTQAGDDPSEQDVDNSENYTELMCTPVFQETMRKMCKIIDNICAEINCQGVPFARDYTSVYPVACEIIGNSIYLVYDDDPFYDASGRLIKAA